MNLYNLEAYGLSGRFAALAGEYPELSAGRILSQEKGLYSLICEEGEFKAQVSGKFRYEAETVSDYPAVGDFVMCRTEPDGGSAVIHKVLARKSVFIRKAAGPTKTEQVVAANIDSVFLCMSLNNDFNLRRLERYLSIAWDSGAVPVILLTKADLCDESEEKRREVESIAVGTDILLVSAMEKDGCEQVLPYLKPGTTAALLGSSGVGKSTLINRLMGEEYLETGGLRSDDKGRHTTTRRQLILLPRGGLVIDTPGMRELGMWNVSEGLDKAFSDIDELAARCRFRGCSHTSEPGCAVLAALQDGSLEPERWNSYLKLKSENAYAVDSESYLQAKKQKFKEIAKKNKNNKKAQ